jgi:hypothetical protein
VTGAAANGSITALPKSRAPFLFGGRSGKFDSIHEDNNGTSKKKRETKWRKKEDNPSRELPRIVSPEAVHLHTAPSHKR